MKYKNIDINKRTLEKYHSLHTLYKTSNNTSICDLNSCCCSNVHIFLPKIPNINTHTP